MSGTLTVSGNEITDLMRASALAWTTANSGGSVDDVAAPDGSYTTWEPGTNLWQHGQCEALSGGTSSLTSGAGAVATISSTRLKFSDKAYAIACDGTVANQNCEHTVGCSIAAGINGAAGCWFQGTAGLSYSVRIGWFNSDSTSSYDGFHAFTATGSPQWIVAPAYPVQAGKTGNVLKLRVEQQGTRAETFYVSNAQIETGVGRVGPYVATNGTAKTRPSTAIQIVYPGLLTPTQGAIFLRVRMGDAPAEFAPRGGSGPIFFAFGDGGGARLIGFVNTTYNGQISMLRSNTTAGGTSTQISTAASQWSNAGDEITIGFVWTATAMKIYINGVLKASNLSTPSTDVPAITSTQLWIGSSFSVGSAVMNAQQRWAALCSGTVTDSDAARIHSNWTTYLAPEDVNGSNAAATTVSCTAVMPFDTATYEDETFVIMDPDGAGASRGLVPRLRVDVDVTTLPTTSTRTWTDITRKVRQLQFSRSGRSDERQRTEVGSLAAVVSNNGGTMTSLGIKKAQWIRVRARWNGVNLPRWQGIFESLPRRWPSAGKDDLYELRAAGTLKTFNFCDLVGQTFPSQRNDQRFAAIAALAIVTTGSIDTNTDLADAVATPYGDGSDALAAIQEIEASENGLILEDPAGTVSFQSRHWRLLNSITPKGTIGDTVGQIPYRDSVSYEDDDQLVANKVSVTPKGGTAVVVQDTTSQGKYWPRKISRTLLTSDVAIATSAAEYLLNRYSDPSPRIPEVEIPLAKVPTNLKAVVLAANNSDRFTFQRSAPTPIIQDYYVEKVSEKITPGVGWAVTFQLSPADREFGWILGDAVYGVLGSTTRLSY